MEIHCWLVNQSMPLNQLSLAFSSFLVRQRRSIIRHLLLKVKNKILKYYFLSNKWVKCRAKREKRHVSAETTKKISLWKLQIGILLLTTLYPWSSNTPPPPPPTTWPQCKNTYKIIISKCVFFNSVLKLEWFFYCCLGLQTTFIRHMFEA